MDELNNRLATIARVAAQRADLPDPATVRRRGRHAAVRRVARGAGVALLVAGLAGGWLGMADRIGTGPDTGKISPAAQPRTIHAAPPKLIERPGSIELRGPAESRTWSYKLTRDGRDVCVHNALLPDGAGGEACGVSLSSADTLNRAQAGCSGQASPLPADNHWETTITGFVSPSAAKVTLKLLDGRTVVAEPVASKEFGVKLFGAWLPGCVSHANIEVEDAAAKVIASNPPYFSDMDGGEEPLGDHMPEDPKIEVRFAGGTPIDRRIQLLVAVERQGAQLYKVDGDRYLLSAGAPLELIKAPLDEAKAAGLLRYSVTRA